MKKFLTCMIAAVMLCLGCGCTTHRQTAMQTVTVATENVATDKADSLHKGAELNLTRDFRVELHDVSIDIMPAVYVPPDSTPTPTTPRKNIKASRIAIESGSSLQATSTTDSVSATSHEMNAEKNATVKEDSSHDMEDGTKGFRGDLICVLLVIAVALYIIYASRKL